MIEIGYPFQIDRTGRTTTVSEEAHVRQLIEQLLFTEPGERVNRPDFGAGLRRLLFAGNSHELVNATEYLVQGALQRFLGDRLQVESVQVGNLEERLEVTVVYSILRTQERYVERFVEPGAEP